MKRLTGILALLFSLLFLVNYANATTYYVSPSGSNGDGLSWTTAKTTIQAAITAATDNDIIYVEGYTTGGSQVTYNLTTPINIPSNRNGLQIIGYNRQAGAESSTNATKPIVDGSGISNTLYAVNGFNIQSDNVTIKNFKVINFTEQASDVGNTTSGPGAGIYTASGTSGHTFSNNYFVNSNYGIYLNNTYNVTVGGSSSSDGNYFTDIEENTGVGGIGVYVYTSGSTVSGTIIKYNTFIDGVDAIDQNYIYFGGSSANAEFSQISYNNFENKANTGEATVEIAGVTGSVDVTNNTWYNCYGPLYIHGAATDNQDLYVANNNFRSTQSTWEVRTDNNFSGYTLFEIMKQNENTYTYGSDVNGVLAVTHYTNDEILTIGGFKTIRNEIPDATTDAVTYSTTANCRIYIPGNSSYPNTIYATNTTGTINHTTNTIKVYGENSTYAKVVSKYGVNAAIFTVNASSPTIFDNVNIVCDATSNSDNDGLLRFVAGSVTVNNCNFTTTGTPTANNFYAIRVEDLATATISNNTFNGDWTIGVNADPVNASITCNTFTSTKTGATYAINIADLNSLNEPMKATIINNTFTGWNTAALYGTITAATATDDIKFGNPTNGNILNLAGTAVGVDVVVPVDELIIQGNKFVHAGSGNLINITTGAVNASQNYLNGLTTASAINAKISGTVNWAPVVTSATDTDPSTCGFKPDLTSIWAPVYTSNSASATMLNATNYYATIQGAVTGDVLYYVNLNDAAFTENVTVNRLAYIRKASEMGSSTVTVTGAAAGPTFDIQVDGTGSATPVALKNLIINSYNSATTDYNVNLLGGGVDGIDFFLMDGCTLNLGSSVTSALYFVEGSGLSEITIQNSHFLGNSTTGIMIDFPATLTTTTADNVTIDNNIFHWTSNAGYNLKSYSSTNLTISGNTFTGGTLWFLEGESDVSYSTVQVTENYFNYVNGANYIQFTGTVGAGTGNINGFSFEQNYFDGNGGNLTAFHFDNSLDENNLSNNGITVKENYFNNFDNNDFVVYFNVNLSSDINWDFTNNYYGHAAGPRATGAAPTWHSYYGTALINTNSYDYSNQLGKITDNEVGYQYRTINFVPWWSDISGSIGSYSGTEFAPIYNDETITEYFGNLIDAVDGTDLGPTNTIYMKNGDYTESPDNEIDARFGTVSTLTIQRATSSDVVNIYQAANGTAMLMARYNAFNGSWNYNLKNLNFYQNGKSSFELVYFGEEIANAPQTINANVDYCKFYADVPGNIGQSLLKFDGLSSPYDGTISVTNSYFEGNGTNYGQLYLYTVSSNPTISNNTFNMPNNYGIYLAENTGTTTITSNTFKGTNNDLNEYGINIVGAVPQLVNIGGSASTANSFGTSSNRLQGGITISGNGNHVINATYNTFYDVTSYAPNNGNALATQTGTGDYTINFSNNTVYDTYLNTLYFFNTPTTGNIITISNNTVTLSQSASNFANFNANMGNSASPTDITITNNSVTASSNTSGSGVIFQVNQSTITGVTIQQNLLTGFNSGIKFTTAQTNSANFTINQNHLGGNTYGFVNGGASNFTITNNWWGNANGPKTSGSGLTDPFKNVFNVASQGADVVSNGAGLNTYWPWWFDITGAPGSYTGTSFAPIVKTTTSPNVVVSTHPNFTSAFASFNNNIIYVASKTAGVSDTYTESVDYPGAVLATNYDVIGKIATDIPNWITTPWDAANSYTNSTAGASSFAPKWNTPTGATYLLNFAGVSRLDLYGFIFEDNNNTNGIFNIASGTNSDLMVHYSNYSNSAGVPFVNFTSNTSILNTSSFDYNVITYTTNSNTWFDHVGSALTSIQITDNIITNSEAWFTLSGANNITTVDIQQNTFNTINGALLFDGIGGPTGTFSAITINENIFNNNGVTTTNPAIEITNGLSNANVTTSWYADFFIHHNSFLVGDNNYGILFSVNTPSSNINATCNWWGHLNGPRNGSNPMGLSGTNNCQVSNNVTFLTWLTSTSPSLATAPCDGFWVYTVASSRLPYTDPSAEYFMTIQDAINDGTNNYIYAKDAYTVATENITLLSGALQYLGKQTAGGTVQVVNVTTTLNSDLTLEDNLNASGNFTFNNTGADITLSGKTLTIGGNLDFAASTNSIIFETNGTMTVGGNLSLLNNNNTIDMGTNGNLSLTGNLTLGATTITLGSRIKVNNGLFQMNGLVSGYSATSYTWVEVDGTGYFKRNNLNTTAINYFPVGTTTYNTGLALTETQNKWSGSTSVQVNVSQVDPTSAAGKNLGDDEYVLHNIWRIKQTTPEVTGQLVTANFFINPLWNGGQKGVNFNRNQSFGANWNNLSSDWDSYRTESSWSTLDGVTTVNNITYNDMNASDDYEWAIFSGTSDAPLSNKATVQAKSIIFTTKTSSTINLWWIKGNGTYSTVIVKPSSSSAHSITDATMYNDLPIDGYNPTPNASFTSAPNAHPTSGTTARIVYDGTGNSATVTGLTSGQYYTFVVLTGNGTGDKRNYLHKGLYETSDGLEDAFVVGYNPGSLTPTNNERTTMTRPKIALNFDNAAATAISGATVTGTYNGTPSVSSPSYVAANDQITVCSTLPMTYSNLLRFDFTGTPGSPVTGWTIKYTKVGSGTTTISPNPTTSPKYVNVSLGASDYNAVYSMVSAIDGAGTLCENTNENATFTTYVTPSYTLSSPAQTCTGNTITITPTAITGYPTVLIDKWQKWNGSAWVDLTNGSGGYSWSLTSPFALTISNAAWDESNNKNYRAILDNGVVACGANRYYPQTTNLTGPYATVTLYDQMGIVDNINGVLSNQEACYGSDVVFGLDIPLTLHEYNPTHVIIQTADDAGFTINLTSIYGGSIGGLPVANPGAGNSGAWYTSGGYGHVDYQFGNVGAAENGKYIRFGFKQGDCAYQYLTGSSAMLTTVPNPTITNAGTATWSSPTVCEGTSLTTSITINGTNISKAYWEYAPAGSTSWAALNATGNAVGTATAVSGFGKYTVAITGTTTTLTLTEMVNQDNSGTDWRFRVNFTNGNVPCATGFTDITNELTVDPSFTFNTQPANGYICDNGNATFTVATTAGSPTYQWQYSTNNVTWNNLTDGGVIPTIAGATTNTLSLTGVPNVWNNFYFRCLVSDGSCVNVASNSAQLKVYQLLVGTNPSSGTYCQGATLNLSASAGSNVSFGTGNNTYQVQWQYSSDNFTWSDISGETNLTYTTTLNTPGTHYYRAQFSITNGNGVTGQCAINTTSATIVVNPTPVAVTGLGATEINTYNTTISWTNNGAASYEYSLDGSTWTSMGLTNPYTIAGLSRATTYTIYVRGQYGVCGAGPTANISITTLDPTIALTGGGLTFPNTTIGSNSAAQTYTVTATQLENPTGDLVITSPGANFEVSLDGITWGASVTPTLSGSETAGFGWSGTLYARFTPQAPCGLKSGNITHTATNATTQNMAVSGTALNAAPTTQASNIDFTSDNGTTITGTLTAGNGTGRIVVMNTSNSFTSPTDGTVYSIGNTIGTSTVVYVGTGTSFTATVTPSTDVWFAAYEYNDCSGSDPIYNVTLPGLASGNQQQVKTFYIDDQSNNPIGNQSSNVAFNIGVTPVGRDGLSATTHQGLTFTITPSGTTTVGSGSPVTLGSGASYTGTLTLVNASGNATQTFTVTRTGGSLGWISNTSNQFVLFPPEPTNQDRIVYYGTTTCSTTVVNWTKGSNTPASNSLVIARQGSTPTVNATTLPDGTAFTTNLNFASAPSVGTTGGYGVAYVSGNTATISGLSASTTYFFRIVAAYGGSPAASGGATNAATNYNVNTATLNPTSKGTTSCKSIEAGLATVVDGYNAKSYNNKVYTNWSTVSEYNNAGFELYRLDVSQEIPIYLSVGSYLNNASLVGMNNSFTGRNYSFVDESAENGKTYLYKLISFSIDGEATEHGTVLVTVNNNTGSVSEMTISDITPNPVTESAKVSFTLTDNQQVTIEVVDVTGRVIAVPFNNASFDSGLNTVGIELGDIASGTYSIVIKSGNSMVSKRFVVVK